MSIGDTVRYRGNYHRATIGLPTGAQGRVVAILATGQVDVIFDKDIGVWALPARLLDRVEE